MRCCWLGLTALVLLAAAASAAHANAGTALMWVGILHFWIGNAIIGLMEGLLLAWRYRAEKAQAIFALISANYASTFAGLVAVAHSNSALDRLSPAPLYDGPRFLVASMLVLFVATIFIEWPFCAWAVGRRKRRAWVGLRASVMAQVASYALMVPLYWSQSTDDLYRQVVLDRSLVAAQTPDAIVYYLVPDATAVRRIRLDGTGDEAVSPVPNAKGHARLYAKQSRVAGHLDLCARLLWTDRSLVIREAFATRAAPVADDRSSVYPEEPVADLRPTNARQWDVSVGLWPNEGLWASNSATGNSIHLALETPLLTWGANAAVVLPGDRVVFVLGDQIVLLDLPTRRLGFLAKGISPVVVPVEQPARPAAAP